MSYQILSIADQAIFHLDAIKNYLRISHNYDDVWISELILASIDAAENFLRRRLLATKILVHTNRIDRARLELPLAPIAEVLAITVHNGSKMLLPQAEYNISDQVITFRNLPIYQYITVEYIAGYLDQKAIPPSIKQGILLHIAEIYDRHANASAISGEVRKLYQPFRKILV
jgi:uncharacterized phiE125 gp8 family phage protein